MDKNRLFMAAAVASAIPLAVCACPPKPPISPPASYDAPAPDALPPLETCADGRAVPADCRVACEALAKIGCPESATVGGRSCGCTCEVAEANGSPLPTICVANQATADGMRECGVRCAGR